jgi:energy-coupling factor transporter ATP-binding protein EcfA2
MNKPLPLVVKDISFRYRDRPEWAIHQVSFSLGPGEVLLVAGASGCGKTTLARCINGLIPHSYKGELQGSINLHGRETRTMSLSEVSQVVGTVLQDPERQIVGSSVLTEVAFGPENLGLPRDEIGARIDEVLQRLGITHLKQRETFALSGGEKQKVVLAGVLAMRPSILLLDEPLASLDPASAREALALFRSLADEGTSILLIEHRVEDALQVRPDRLLYMRDSQVHYLGPIKELPAEVNHREVKLPAPWLIRRLKESGEPLPEPPPPVSAPPASMPGEPLTIFEDVSFAYPEGPLVLHDINLQVRRGDLIAVLGPNGAGKSTLVKHAIGLLKPTRGRVLVQGKDTRSLSVAQIAHTLGYAFQSPAHMLFAPTVQDELAFGPRNLDFSPPAIDAAVTEAVTALNLQGLESYSPLALSFGQQKRTTIASVLAMHSRILILDEPTAGQDYANYTRFMETLCGAVGSGASFLTSRFDATLFITHDLDLAIGYANRVILLSEGRIVADGPPQEALRDPALLERCRVVPTTLLRTNLEYLPRTGRFLRAEYLASIV